MPNLITHIYIGKEVAKRLPADMQKIIEAAPDAFRLGCWGPDFIYAIRQLGDEVGRYANILHCASHVEILEKIADYIRENNQDDIMKSYALGFMCHYVADSNIHPFVNYFNENKIPALVPKDQIPHMHSLIESAADEYVIYELMGYKTKGKKYNNPSAAYKPGQDLKINKNTRKAVLELYNAAIDEKIGLKLTAAKVNKTIFFTKLFVNITVDTKKGGMRKFATWFEKTFIGDRSITALMRPPEGYDVIDYLNFNHDTWTVSRNRFDKLSTLDLPTLIKKVIYLSISYYLPEMYRLITEGGHLNPERFRNNFEGIDVGIVYDLLNKRDVKGICRDNPEIETFLEMTTEEDAPVEESSEDTEIPDTENEKSEEEAVEVETDVPEENN